MADTKISAMPTLANPPLAPVFLSGITNDGTTATNVQIPQGVIVQPANSGHGIVIKGAKASGSGSASLYGAVSGISGGTAYATSTGHSHNGGDAYIQSGAAGAGTIVAIPSQVYLTGGKALYNGRSRGGKINLSTGGGYYAGPIYLHAGAGTGPNQIGGSLYLYGGAGGTNALGGHIQLTPGTGGTGHGNLIIQNLGTADPHVLNAAWLGVSNGVTLSAG